MSALVITIIAGIYFISFLLFAISDSPFHDKNLTSLACQYYIGALLLLSPIFAYYSIGKDNLRQIMKKITYSSSKEILLDNVEKAVVEPNIHNDDLNTLVIINIINIGAILFFAKGEILEFDGSMIEVLSVMHAMIWIVVGGIFVMAKN